MKYLVNRETKEHFVYHGIVPSENWDVVEADAEGWIKWDGGKCPLPDGDPCQLWLKYSNRASSIRPAGTWSWVVNDFTKYRPILDKPDIEFLEACNNSVGERYAEDYNAAVDSVLERAIEEAAASEVRLPTLLERLKAAHEAAQRIPEMEAELREVLGAMGYDLVARSPFVEMDSEPLGAEFESALMNNLNNLYDDTPEPDMNDWRNWRPGDLVERVRKHVEQCAKLGGVYRLTIVDTTVAGPDRVWYTGEDGLEFWSSPNNFRWHSRPEVKS